jgi:hypothetical protein
MQRINSVESTSFWGRVISGHKTTGPAFGLRQRDREKKHKNQECEREKCSLLPHI